jgi:hypothetical protein
MATSRRELLQKEEEIIEQFDLCGEAERLVRMQFLRESMCSFGNSVQSVLLVVLRILYVLPLFSVLIYVCIGGIEPWITYALVGIPICLEAAWVVIHLSLLYGRRVSPYGNAMFVLRGGIGSWRIQSRLLRWIPFAILSLRPESTNFAWALFLVLLARVAAGLMRDSWIRSALEDD